MAMITKPQICLVLLQVLGLLQVSVCIDAVNFSSVDISPEVAPSMLEGSQALTSTTKLSTARRRRRRSSGATVDTVKKSLSELGQEIKDLNALFTKGLEDLAKSIAASVPTSGATGNKCCLEKCAGTGGCFKGLFCCPIKGMCLDSKTKSSLGSNCDACKKAHSNEAVKEDKKLTKVCASEGGKCKCKGMVYYGKRFKSGKPGKGTQITTLAEMKKTGYKEKYAAKEISCTSSPMGGDPLHGYYKQCMCIPGPPSTKEAAKPGIPAPAPPNSGNWAGPVKGKPAPAMSDSPPADPCPKPMRKRSNGVCSWKSSESHGMRTMELDEGVSIIKKACDSSPGCGVFECTRAALG